MKKPPDAVALGAWRCPSGNQVEASLSGPIDGPRDVHLLWDRDPSPADLIWYVGKILPAITRRIQEYMEKPGPAIAVLAL